MSGRENFYYFVGHYLAESYFARHCPAERFFFNILVDMSGRELFCWTLSGKECFFFYILLDMSGRELFCWTLSRILFNIISS